MRTCRLIYKSVAREETLSNQALSELQETSARNNEQRGITGLLALSGNQFLQALEGDGDSVNDLYAKIVNDPRHHKVRLISFESATERYFEDWAMRLVDLYDLPLQPRKYLARKYSNLDDTVKIPDQINLVYSLLLDAKTICLNVPWS